MLPSNLKNHSALAQMSGSFESQVSQKCQSLIYFLSIAISKNYFLDMHFSPLDLATLTMTLRDFYGRDKAIISLHELYYTAEGNSINFHIV